MAVSGQPQAPAALPRGIVPQAPNSVDGWEGGPRAGLDTVEKRKTSCLYKESNPGRPARKPSPYWLRYPGFFYSRFNCYMH
jgi:hypothetical protein